MIPLRNTCGNKRNKITPYRTRTICMVQIHSKNERRVTAKESQESDSY